MSKLEELIQKLCPNGVEYRPLGELCEIRKGKQLNKDGLLEQGNYPVINGGINPSGYWNEYNFEKDLITISQGGASAGYVNFITTKFWAGAHCYVLVNPKNCLNYRLLYHIVKNYEKELMSAQVGAGIPSVSSNKLTSLSIPVPPIEVQEEIVRILDKFTELSARKKQYEFYRDRWLNNIPECKMMRICDFAECVTGATPSTSKREYWENGTIQWMSSGEVNLFEVFQTEKKITQLGYEKCSTTIVPIDTVVIALAGQGKTRGKVAITRTPLCTNQSLCSIIVNRNIVDSEYLLFYLQSKYDDLRRISSGDGTRGGLNLKIIKNYTVPIPPLNTQKEIIENLKYFSKLCNDISEGLPAEIKARQKQYEYYREKLLQFRIKN
mgnify:CR=1 FL=1